MVAQEANDAFFDDFASRDIPHERYDLAVSRHDAQPVQQEKSIGRQLSRAFVSIHQWVVACQTEKVSGSEFVDVRLSVVSFLHGTSQRRFERVPILQAFQSAVLGDLFVMNDLDGLAAKPFPSRHFASSRRATRYCAIPSRAASNCSARLVVLGSNSSDCSR